MQRGLGLSDRSCVADTVSIRRFGLYSCLAEVRDISLFQHYMNVRSRLSCHAALRSQRKSGFRPYLPELIEAHKELDRSRVGRTVRREGKAETIADERAALANSLANAPGWSVIE